MKRTNDGKNPSTHKDAWRDIDETQLNCIDRLGLAYCRLNGFEWDDILGPAPNEFDKLPKAQKDDYIKPAIEAIRSIIGEANCSRCWWMFKLGKSKEEWFRWYVTERFRTSKKP